MNISTRSSLFFRWLGVILGKRRSIWFNLRRITVTWNIQGFNIKINISTSCCLPIWLWLYNTLTSNLIIIWIEYITRIHHIEPSINWHILLLTTITSLSNHWCSLSCWNIWACTFKCIWASWSRNLASAIYMQNCRWWVNDNSLSKNLWSIL